MRTKKIETIQCPYCNTEYLPVEIFNPKSFFGKPECIIRESGKIEDIVGSSMDLKESYICVINFSINFDSVPNSV